MRLLAVTFLCLIYLATAPDPVAAQKPDKKPSAAPSDGVIVAMAQKFVAEHFKRRTENNLGIAFDTADIHPQDDPDNWAVVGGFMADSGGKTSKPHAFGIVMRLTCPDHDALKCWRMEKLVIDRAIILNN